MSNFTNCPFANQDPALRSTNYTKGRTYNKKTYTIKRITLHCVVGHPSLKNLAAVFQGSRKASSNYGIDDNGNIGLFVEEKDRSWCSSNGLNDAQAITVEINSDTTAPYAMKEASVNGAIKLCIDICKRNGIKKMYWYPDKETCLMKADMLKEDEGIFTAHRFFAAKSCPGEWLFSRMGWVCDQVNAGLAEDVPETPAPEPTPEPVIPTKYWRVQTGAFRVKENSDKLVARLKAKGYDTYVVVRDGLYKVQLGAFSKKYNADAFAVQLMMDGFDTYVVYY